MLLNGLNEEFFLVLMWKFLVIGVSVMCILVSFVVG